MLNTLDLGHLVGRGLLGKPGIHLSGVVPKGWQRCSPSNGRCPRPRPHRDSAHREAARSMARWVHPHGSGNTSMVSAAQWRKLVPLVTLYLEFSKENYGDQLPPSPVLWVFAMEKWQGRVFFSWGEGSCFHVESLSSFLLWKDNRRLLNDTTDTFKSPEPNLLMGLLIFSDIS